MLAMWQTHFREMFQVYVVMMVKSLNVEKIDFSIFLVDQGKRPSIWQKENQLVQKSLIITLPQNQKNLFFREYLVVIHQNEKHNQSLK